MNQGEEKISSVNLDPQATNTELKSLLERNLSISQEILDISMYIRGYIFWRKVMGFIQLVLIIVPIVLAVFYLPPFLEDLLDKLPSYINNGIN